MLLEMDCWRCWYGCMGTCEMRTDVFGNAETGAMEDDDCTLGARGTGGASGWLKLTLSAAAAVAV